jgi:hypothetical protein
VALNVQQENVLLSMRLWSLKICDLAVELARQAGEEASRPLSEAQIQRALEAHRRENAVCVAWLLDVWDQIEHDTQPARGKPSPSSP